MTAAIGDNSKVDREKRVLFGYYHRKDRDIAIKIRGLQVEKKKNRQNAKASGIAGQKLDHYLKTFEAEDQQKPIDKHKSDRENLIWLGLIPDDSGDLLADRATDEQMVQARGFHAGLTGLGRVSGFDAGSADDKLWLESYDLGREEYNTTVPDLLKRALEAHTKEAPAPETAEPFDD